jgi:hypothetical protein
MTGMVMRRWDDMDKNEDEDEVDNRGVAKTI